MDIFDVRTEVLLNTNFKNIKNACATDKMSRLICSRKSFWKAYIQKHNLPLLIEKNETYETPEEWIFKIHKTIIYDKTLDYLNYISNANHILYIYFDIYNNIKTLLLKNNDYVNNNLYVYLLNNNLKKFFLKIKKTIIGYEININNSKVFNLRKSDLFDLISQLIYYDIKIKENIEY